MCRYDCKSVCSLCGSSVLAQRKNSAHLTQHQDTDATMPASIDNASPGSYCGGSTFSNMLFWFTWPPPNLAMRNHVLGTGGGGGRHGHTSLHIVTILSQQEPMQRSTKMKHGRGPRIKLPCRPRRPLSVNQEEDCCC